MELIPILSTIVLVMTIATCILAVAAYFLYKARERTARKRRDNGTAPAVVQAEEPHMLVAPQSDLPQPALGRGTASYEGEPHQLAPPQEAPLREVPSQEYAFDEHAQRRRDERSLHAYAEPQPPRPAHWQDASDYGYDRPSSAPAADYDDRAQDRRPPQQGALFYEYTGEGGFVPLDPQQERPPSYDSPPRHALPAAPPPIDPGGAAAAQHYADRQRSDVLEAEAQWHRERDDAVRTRSRAAEAPSRGDARHEEEAGFEWL